MRKRRCGLAWRSEGRPRARAGGRPRARGARLRPEIGIVYRCWPEIGIVYRSEKATCGTSGCARPRDLGFSHSDCEIATPWDGKGPRSPPETYAQSRFLSTAYAQSRILSMSSCSALCRSPTSRERVRPARLFRVRGCSPLPSSAVIVRAGLPPMGSREAAATGLARTMRGPFCMPPLARGTARAAE